MIDGSLAEFLQQGLGIHVGTRDARHQPNGARALALTVDADGAHLTVYLAKVAATRLLADLESNRQIAVSLGRPVDDRACQVKGVVTAIRAARAAERAVVTAQFEGFRDQLDAIGIPRVLTERWATWPAMAIEFRATAVFEQTPGPGAGEALP